MAEKAGLTRFARGFALSLRLLHLQSLKLLPSNFVLHPWLACASGLILLRKMAEKAGFEPAEPF